MKVTRCLFMFLTLILAFISQVFAVEKAPGSIPDPQIIYTEKGAVYITPTGEIFACRYYSPLEALLGWRTDQINTATCISPNHKPDWHGSTHRWDRENNKEFHGYVDSQGNRYECPLIREICDMEIKFNSEFYSDEFCVDYTRCVKVENSPSIEDTKEPLAPGTVHPNIKDPDPGPR